MNPITVKNVITQATIDNWDWDKSVAKVRGLYLNSWKNTSTELLEELFQAKQQINNGPGNPHGRYTWKKYCEKAFNGTPTQRTIDTWLRRYEIGEEAWKELQAEKKSLTPVPVSDDTLLIVKQKKNKDGSYTVRLKVSEYPDIVFEEQVVLEEQVAT